MRDRRPPPPCTRRRHSIPEGSQPLAGGERSDTTGPRIDERTPIPEGSQQKRGSNGLLFHTLSAGQICRRGALPPIRLKKTCEKACDWC